VLVYDGFGKFTILTKSRVSGDGYGEVMDHLIVKVDAVIKDILDEEGSDGYKAAK
jgi:hypothetical protein